MSHESISRFDVDAAREIAGEKAFARGSAYYRDGVVRILAIEKHRVLALVSGTEDYRVELTGHGKMIAGTCSCRAFEDRGFCKHLVATALAANAASRGAESDGAFGRIRDYLKARSADALIGMIVEWAKEDYTLFRKLDLAAASIDPDSNRLKATLRKAIDNATRIRGFVDYSEAGGWASVVDEALDAIEALATGQHAGVVLELAERSIDRIEAAIGSIDDSDGYGTELLRRAGRIHLAAAKTSRPDAVPFARDLFEREMEDEYETFDGAAARYAEVLGDAGLAEYRRLAFAKWDKLPSRGVRSRGELIGEYHRLAEILDFFAERDGDVEARVALRTKDLSSPWNYLQLAEFCRAQGRSGEALRWAEEGLWMFEDGQPDERLVLFAAGLLQGSGRADEAQKHLSHAFGKAPSLELYERLRKVGGPSAGDWALDFLEAALGRQQHTGSHHPGDLLIEVLIQEKLFDRAWAIVRKHGASAQSKESLARASEATHREQAIDIYVERVDQLAAAGGDHAYAEAMRLINRMAGLRDAAGQAAYLADLKIRFGRKRNLMKLLA
ncbi:MAG TPA: SWIM zinc finger family protein [Micropepsaceae bacterium]|nr:SWIM zinc finger family protein [Micropepsaceae bacterium]